MFFLYIFGVQRDLLAQQTSAVFCDQIILFVADTTEVFVGFQLVVVEELGEFMLASPEIDQFGDEINTRFDGQDEARFQFAAQAQ